METKKIEIIDFTDNEQGHYRQPEIVDIRYLEKKNDLLDAGLIRCFDNSVTSLHYLQNIVNLINDPKIDTIIIKKYYKEI